MRILDINIHLKSIQHLRCSRKATFFLNLVANRSILDIAAQLTGFHSKSVKRVKKMYENKIITSLL